MKRSLVAVLLALGIYSVVHAESIGTSTKTSESIEAFQQKIFAVSLPVQEIWMTKQSQQDITTILARDFTDLKVPYWGEGTKTIWLFERSRDFDAVAIGIAIDDGKVEDITLFDVANIELDVSRFVGASLASIKSVAAAGDVNVLADVKKLVHMALYCHELTPFAEYSLADDDSEPSP